jgi:hypothetical protein
MAFQDCFISHKLRKRKHDINHLFQICHEVTLNNKIYNYEGQGISGFWNNFRVVFM